MAEPQAKKLKLPSGKELFEYEVDAAHPVPEQYYAALLHSPVDKFFEPQTKIIFCWRQDKVADVWEALVKHNFLSMPVLQKTETRWYGFITIGDIVHYLMNQFSGLASKETEDPWKVVNIKEVFGDLEVKDIMESPTTRKNVFHPVSEGYSLLFALELLAKEAGLHRVPIVDKNRQMVNLITQSQLIRFLRSNIESLGARAQKPLKDCAAFFKNIITVKETQTVVEAFTIMSQKHITGLAVVNDNGELVDNLSTRDSKSVDPHLRNFWRFYQEVRNYTRHLREEYQKVHGRPKHAVNATPSDTISTVLEKLADNNIHRLYIVDNAKRPIGLVSLKDILLELLR